MNKRSNILLCARVCEMLSISKSTLYDWINPKSPRYDNHFPRPIKLGSSAVGWVEIELEAWLVIRRNNNK